MMLRLLWLAACGTVPSATANTAASSGVRGIDVAGLLPPPQPQAVDAACDLFVSTKGDDTNRGTSVAAPFKNLQHAIWWGDPETQGDRTICLRAGDSEVHRLNATVTIGAGVAHAGRGLKITTFPPDRAAGLGRAQLSGGIIVGPFSRRTPGDAWLTATPPAARHHRPSLMLMDKRWLQRARLPRPDPVDESNRFTGDASTYKYVGPLQQPNASRWPAADRYGFKYNRSDAFAQHLPLYQQDEVQVLHFHAWTAFWSNVSTISGGLLKFKTPTITNVGQWAYQGGQRYLLENVKEGLAAPGDWYWDESRSEVLLIPPDGTNGSATVYTIAPQLQQLLTISDASHVSLVDLEFMHADVGDRVDVYYSNNGAVTIGAEQGVTSDVRLERVAVRHCGGAGISVLNNVQRLEVIDSAVLSVGGSGIQVPQGSNVTDVMIHNSFVNDTALIILGQPGGIRVKGQRNMTVTHNTVSHVPYAGIMIGWQKITDDTQKDTIFDIGHNHVHDYGLGILSDFGGIYLSSADNLCFQKQLCTLPTHIHGNHIHDCRRYNYGCQGVYMDEQVSGVIIERNLIHDVENQGVYFHCGSGNVFRNNIVAFAGTAPGEWPFVSPDISSGLLPGMCNSGGNPTYPEMGALGFNLTTNIVLLSSQAAIVGRPQSSQSDVRNSHWARNTYFSHNATIVDLIRTGAVWPNGTTLAEWSESEHAGRGADASVVADPMFADPSSRNFTLLPSSPALRLGFQELDDAASAGCSGNPFEEVRRTLPQLSFV